MEQLPVNESPGTEEQLGTLVGRGRTAEVYRWGSSHVLKLFLPTVSSDTIEHEHRVALALKDLSIPAPGYCGWVRVHDRPGMLFERVDGHSMLDALGRRPDRVLRLAYHLADVHLAIHQTAVAPTLPLQRAVLEATIAQACSLSDRVRTHILRALRTLPDGDRICHGDLHPDNVLLTKRGPIVIDWVTATRGCPLADVARTLILLRHGALPPGTSPMTVLLTQAIRKLFADAYWRHYQARSRLRAQDLAPWWAPVMAARLGESPPNGEQQRLLRMLEASVSHQA